MTQVENVPNIIAGVTLAAGVAHAIMDASTAIQLRPAGA